MTQSSDAAAPDQEPLAPLGGPAESEPPAHTGVADHPGASSTDGSTIAAVEDAPDYELAVEDGAPLAGTGDDPGAGPLAPEFREPGEEA